MQRPQLPRFEPVDPLPFTNGARLHESSRTSMSTNAGPDGRAQIQLTTSRLSMTAEAGVLLVRFTGHRAAAANDRQFRVPRRSRRAP